MKQIPPPPIKDNKVDKKNSSEARFAPSSKTQTEKTLTLVEGSETPHLIVFPLPPPPSNKTYCKTVEPGVEQIFPGLEQPPPVKEAHENMEIDWGDQTKAFKLPIGWIILVLILLAWLIVQSTFMIKDGEVKSDQAISDLTETIQVEQKQTDQVKLGLHSAIASYLAADTIETKLQWVRDPERVRPMMEHYYKTHSFQPTQFHHIRSINFVSFWLHPFVLLIAETSNGKPHFLTLEQTDTHSFRVDWETDVYYLPMSWSDFLKQRPTTSIAMRVKVKPDSLYTFQFRNESVYECFRLISRNNSRPAYGYVKIGTPVWHDLRRFFELRRKSSNDGEALILQLRFPSSKQQSPSDNGVIIEKFISDRWVFPISTPHARHP